MLLIFNNNFEDVPGRYACDSHVIDTKYVEGSSNLKERDYYGRKSRAIVPPITICNQGLQSLFEDRRLDRFISEQE